ncbi:helix-turn-helix transcriptional regulator [Ventosimonas gracilis]|uniref:helix-turn-helix transcriptional regulator n=1 Tax=Ventosimonas gracilis TaxID=1680762 RepID=UPI0009A248CC|nr:helix-turn-helix transcriptional regulator [Ventosimonas gracilis]
MNRIREARRAAGIAQADLYRKIGWGQSRLGNYERGVRVPALNDCRRIVAALRALGADCTLDDVFPEPADLRGGEQPQPQQENSHAQP